ncbi:MAG: SufD family Fe-S cluster assembly protein [Phascolarctobacterium sp.]|nr:SufD family Fe-S cluster assembly protein [Phascolarctobacterium sp.]
MTEKETLKAALEKKAALGNDIDLSKFDDNDDVHLKSTEEISVAGKSRMEHVGIELDAENRSGSFIQADNAALEQKVRPQTPLELMNTGIAAQKYSELVKKYWWKAVSADTDKYTAITALEKENGYFIRVKAGKKIKYPLQACIFISHEQQLQRVHNVVIVEDDAELNIISGCASDPEVDKAIHLGISEFFIGKNAKLTFTMIHSWGENVAVRPRTVSIVEEGGQFISNYVCMEKVKDVQMNPVTRLVGKGAVARLNSILVAPKGSHLDIGGKAILEVPGTRAEIVARTISTGGEVVNRGTMIGQAEGVRAHLECHGLMLSNDGYISAIPQLDAFTGNAELSHEAAVGRIAPEEIEYLMARGLDEEEATSTIVRGFLNINIEGLPESLAAKIADTLDTFTLEKGL